MIENQADPAEIIAENMVPVPPAPKPTSKPKKATKTSSNDCSDLSEDERADAIREQLSTITNLDVMDNDMSPQGRAYDWITYFDSAQLCPGGKNEHLLNQRYILATLYFSTRGDEWFTCYMSDPNCEMTSISVSEFKPVVGGVSGAQGSKAWLSGDEAGSECNWFGVDCNAGLSVQNLELRKWTRTAF